MGRLEMLNSGSMNRHDALPLSQKRQSKTHADTAENTRKYLSRTTEQTTSLSLPSAVSLPLSHG
jgi:hypothetical protein